MEFSKFISSLQLDTILNELYLSFHKTIRTNVKEMECNVHVSSWSRKNIKKEAKIVVCQQSFFLNLDNINKITGVANHHDSLH